MLLGNLQETLSKVRDMVDCKSFIKHGGKGENDLKGPFTNVIFFVTQNVYKWNPRMYMIFCRKTKKGHFGIDF